MFKKWRSHFSSNIVKSRDFDETTSKNLGMEHIEVKREEFGEAERRAAKLRPLHGRGSSQRGNTMKKLNITKERFEKSRYFKNKYGKLEYVSESGKLFKTDKGKVLMFKESSEEDLRSSGGKEFYAEINL